MNAVIEKAIKELLKKLDADSTPDAVLKITQAALNLAHTSATLSNRN